VTREEEGLVDPLPLGVLGCGRFGRALAMGFARTPRVRVVACADVDPAAAAACAAALGARAMSPEELLAAPGVMAVAVATPSATHRSCVEAALAAGKHVWCEKPMALTVADCDAMLAAAARSGRCLTVGHMQRHFPLLAAVRAEVHAGAVGRPAAVSLTRREFLPRGPGWLRQRALVGGLPFQSSVHEFDWLRTCCGEVVRVYAQGVGAPLQPQLDFPDAVFVALAFANGCIGALQACMTDFVRAYRGEVNGPDGSLHFDLVAGAYRLGRPDGGVRGVAVPGGSWDETYEAGSRRARSDFVSWVLDGTEPAATALDGRQAVAIASAVSESLARGRPVDVSPPPCPDGTAGMPGPGRTG
jgi:predicted dehydrogenase